MFGRSAVRMRQIAGSGVNSGHHVTRTRHGGNAPGRTQAKELAAATRLGRRPSLLQGWRYDCSDDTCSVADAGDLARYCLASAVDPFGHNEGEGRSQGSQIGVARAEPDIAESCRSGVEETAHPSCVRRSRAAGSARGGGTPRRRQIRDEVPGHGSPPLGGEKHPRARAHRSFLARESDDPRGTRGRNAGDRSRYQNDDAGAHRQHPARSTHNRCTRTAVNRRNPVRNQASHNAPRIARPVSVRFAHVQPRSERSGGTQSLTRSPSR